MEKKTNLHVTERDGLGESPEAVPIAGSNGGSNSKANGHKPAFNLFFVWKEYEGVAMHFNDLLIRLRTQALGGVAALAALAAIMVRGDLAPLLRWSVLACAFFLLLLFWVA